ncbi:MAG: hypothetical protein A2Y74_05325 [Actinobacteria bacterium RBG_13_63_9]|nr:MAG: hypothetical protein A2Y74_05325 [Actinobacteria bacterium RBG_13_63_9]
MTTLLRMRGLAECTTPEFRRALVELAARLRIDPDWLSAVIAFESAATWAPNVTFGGGRYRGPQDEGKAVGLIQFTNVALDAMMRRGWPMTKAHLAEMSAEHQLAWVERYFSTVLGGRQMESLGDVYMAVFAPSAVGRGDSTILYQEPSGAYSANRPLDGNSDGAITRGEAVRPVRVLLSEALGLGPMPVDGGEGDALAAFPDSGRPSLDDLSAVRQSVVEARDEICARLDAMNGVLRELTTRLGA